MKNKSIDVIAIDSLKSTEYEPIAIPYVICEAQTQRDINLVRVGESLQKARVAKRPEIREQTLQAFFHVRHTDKALTTRKTNNHRLFFFFLSPPKEKI